MVLNRFAGRSSPALLALSTLLSWEEAVTREGTTDQEPIGAFLPLTNAPVLQLLSRAVLLARTQPTASSVPGAQSITAVLNVLGDVLSGTPDKLKRIENMTQDELFLEVMLPLIKHQFRLDARRAPDGLARAYALFFDFPSRHSMELQRRMAGQYFDLPALFEKHVGLSTLEVLMGAIAFWGIFQYRFTTTYASERFRTEDVVPTVSTPRQAVALEAYLNTHLYGPSTPQGNHAIWRNLWLSRHDALKVLTPLPAHKRPLWLSRLSATPQTLQANFQKRAYAVGPLEHRALPLEEHPLVRMTLPELGECFTIPNARSFMKGAPELVDRLARAHLPPEKIAPFDALRGLLQEIYLRELAQRLPQPYSVIPETRYKRPGRGGDPADGPDLTIIDQDARALILVESKARPFTDVARAADGTNGLKRMDELLTDAAIKARWKAADLRDATVGPYQAHQAALMRIHPDRQVVALVHSESLPGFRKAWQLMRAQPSHPLHGDPRRLIPLSMDEFEWMVEAARQTGRSLYAMLRAQEHTTKDPSYVLGAWVIPDLRFEGRYLDHWWTALGRPAQADLVASEPSE